MMSCRLTEGKPEFEAKRWRLQELEGAAQDLQSKFVAAIDEDIRAFNAVLGALRLPKATPDEKAIRSGALQKAFHWATEVPLSVAEDSAAAMELLEELCRIGLKSAISDVGVGGKAARASFDGGRYNVLINLGSIKDAAFADKARHRLAAAETKADRAGSALDALIALELK
jgi:formiminotetrahydrofolate cyclodeaminase